jgi:hypothetical protein
VPLSIKIATVEAGGGFAHLKGQGLSLLKVMWASISSCTPERAEA